MLPRPLHPEIATGFVPIPAGLASEFRQRLNERLQQLQLIGQAATAFSERLVAALGNGKLEGGEVTPGEGLSVRIAPYRAFVGTYLESEVSNIVGGFEKGALHSLWLRQDGHWTLTQPDQEPNRQDGHGECLLWAKVQAGETEILDILETVEQFGTRLLSQGLPRIQSFGPAKRTVVQHIACLGGQIMSGETRYLHPLANAPTVQESARQWRCPASFEVTQLGIYVSENDTTKPSTIRLRRNKANFAPDIAIIVPPRGTGWFLSDQSGMLEAGDLLTWQVIAGSGGSVGLLLETMQVTLTSEV